MPQVPNLDRILLRGQRSVLEAVAAGKPLQQVLTGLCLVVEEESPASLCSILITADGKHLHHGAAPNLPADYWQLLEGLAIGPELGTCGRAAFLARTVVTEEIATDPHWRGYEGIAERFGLGACASTPILAAPDGRVLGSFALYHRQPGPYREEELELMRSLSDLAAIGILDDERRRSLEETQKRLETLELLRPGLSHDLNNLLTAVLCEADAARHSLLPDAPAHASLSTIEAISRRAAQLVRQTLTQRPLGFTRAEVDLNQVISEARRMLATAFLQRVRVELSLAPELPSVLGGSSEIHQVVMNLLINASQAIGASPGTIHITTRQEVLDEAALRRRFAGQGVEAGAHAVLEISDTGSGMTPETIKRLAEPYFTTKRAGRGIGLALTRRILTEHRAGLEVESEVGRGSTFRVLFPLAPRLSPRSTPAPAATWPLPKGLVLVVDEDPLVREGTAHLLQAQRVAVLTAATSEEALLILAKRRDEIKLLLAHQGAGAQLAQVVRSRWPDLLMVMTAGSEDARDTADLPASVVLLVKPYSAQDLREAVVAAQQAVAAPG